MKYILVACEESQAVTIEFRKLGLQAYSCDTQECSGGKPEYHILGDVLEFIGKNKYNNFNGWDLVVAFPPCTDLSGACANLWHVKQADGRQKAAFEFVLRLWESCDKVCIENPQGWLNTNWMKPTQTIHPYYFGDPFSKRTCLWLKNLPPLLYNMHTNLFGSKTAVEPTCYWVSSSNNRKTKRFSNSGKCHTAKDRSKTFPGIAKAMAEQWGNYLINSKP